MGDQTGAGGTFDGAAEGLTPAELAGEEALALPPREAMSLVTTDVIASGDNVAVPINEATAVNLNSDYSVAVADADQIVIIDQTDTDPVADTDSSPHGWGRGNKGG